MSDEPPKPADQTAAFASIWMDSLSKLMQSVFSSGQSSPPPELIREMRAGVFQALARTWEEFMRSPQFLEGMKQWMDNAISFRKLSNDFMAKVRGELQMPSRDDLDAVMLAVRHMEKRLLDRIDELGGAAKSTNGEPKPRAKRARKGGTRTTTVKSTSRRSAKARKP